MTKSMLLAIAEAAGLDPETGLRAPPAPIPTQRTAQPVSGMSLEEKIKMTWDSDPQMRSGFANNFGSYRALCLHEEAKSSGLRPDELKELTPDIAGYIAKLEAAHGRLDQGEKTAIESYAATWRTSNDIRKEFRAFSTYAAYMRAKASGLIKHYGSGATR